MDCILVTGGAGFIGSHFVRYLLNKYDNYEVRVLDKLTYAGNLANLTDIEQTYGPSHRYRFFHGDICDVQVVAQAMKGCKYVLNFAAESHVDRSIDNPGQFIMTDIYGTYILLEQARREQVAKFIQISTDEIYGNVPSGSTREGDMIAPRSPYSASKAGGELIAHAYFVTYGLPVLVTRGSNNFGPFQYPEKLIPLFITNIIDNQAVPVYGDGQQIRDWIYVLDHCEGIDVVMHQGVPGETYNIGGGNEYKNIEIAHFILNALGKPLSLLQHVQDRPGHDRRYSMDTTKICQLGWQPQSPFDVALDQTIAWFCQHEEWWRPLKRTNIVPSFLHQRAFSHH